MTKSEQAFEEWFAAHWPKPKGSRAQISQWKHKRALAMAGWVAGHTWGGYQQQEKLRTSLTPVFDGTGN